jgi:ribosomal protein L7/L12
MRSKTLLSYQKGYCGQPADIEAMKPREARAYCLGVGHVAAGTLPLGSGAEVLAVLSTRRRVEGGDSEAAEAASTFPLTLESEGRNKIDCVKTLRDIAYSLNISRELQFVVNIVRSLPYTFYCRSDAERILASQALRASGAIVTVPPSKDSPR